MQLLYSRNDTSAGMIKYQLMEAKSRGYIASVYSTNSVLTYLNSKYGFNFKSLEYKKSYERYVASEIVDKVMSLNENIINILTSEVDELKSIFFPPEAGKSKEMSHLTDLQYAPVRQAKDKIIDFIKKEITPKCTCSHSQIAGYILDNQGKQGVEASLTYFTIKNEEQKISKTILLDIAKKIMQG